MIPTQILAQTIQLIEGAYAHATIRAYRVDFLDFIEFCDIKHIPALPASGEAVSGFIDSLKERGKKSASIRRAVAGIASIHQINGFADPTKTVECKLAMRRMHRQIGRNSRQAQGLNADLLESLLATTDHSLRGLRDHALMLTAYETLCRRSELVSLRVEDLHRPMPNALQNRIGYAIFLRKSKTDQESIGKWMPISERCHVALQKWIKAANLESGPLFRGIRNRYKLTEGLDAGNVGRIIRRHAKEAGLAPEFIHRLSAHSTRIGAAQDLLLTGASLPILMQRGRWSKAETVMRYVEQVGVAV